MPDKSGKRRKLLLLNYEFPPLGGGGSPVSYEIAKRLVDFNKYEIDVVTMGFKNLLSYEELTPQLKIYRVKCLRKRKESCQPWEQVTYLISAYFKAAELIKKNHYDITHCHFIIPTGVLALILKLRFGLPYIISVHGSDVPGYNPDRFKLLHKFTQPFLKIICDHATKIVALSNYLKNLIRQNIKLYGTEKLVVIPNGIDSSKFLPTEKKKIILSTGRLLPRKGFQHLISAVSAFDLGYEVHICGDGPMMNELKALAKNSKTKVVFHGWIDNNTEKYKNLIGKASIYSLVSERENASVALLEAMSAGCAVITADNSGCIETVGKAGLTIPFGNIQKLHDSIIAIINNSKMIAKLQKRARNRAQTFFAWERVISQYKNILNAEMTI